VPAFDVALRPTKSVSILYGLGDAATCRAVLAAHHAGVAEAAAYLDDHLGARRGHGGHEHVSGQGLLAVGFDHRTSREGDPQLHTHLVSPTVSSVRTGGGRRWTAGVGRPGPVPASAGRRRHLPGRLPAAVLPDPRVEWTAADRHGNRELKSLSEELLRAFSKRSGQIDLEVERLEASGRERTPRLVKWAVQATRKPKRHEAADSLYGRWRTEAAERGHDPDDLVRQVCGRTVTAPRAYSSGRWPRHSTGWPVRTGSPRPHPPSPARMSSRPSAASWSAPAGSRSKAQDGTVEMLRVLRVARRSAMKTPWQAGNQLHACLPAHPRSSASSTGSCQHATFPCLGPGLGPCRMRLGQALARPLPPLTPGLDDG
jgi:hypothetical protein